MNILVITTLIAGVLLLQLVIWILVFSWIKKKSGSLKKTMVRQCDGANDGVVIEPTSALFRGSDAEFGNIKGNGVICLTENNLLFEKLTGQTIKVSRAEIADVSVEQWFKGKPSFATGGKHLVIKTMDGNRIGFLVRDPALWINKIKP